MENSIFKNKRNIGSIEELQKNVKTINPGIWVLIAAVLSFLIGLIIFICTTTYTSTLPVFAYCKNKIVYYYVKEENHLSVKLGQKVSYQDSAIVDTITGGSMEPLKANGLLATESMMSFGNYIDGENVYEAFSGESEMSEGYHQAYIHLDNYRLIDSFFN